MDWYEADKRHQIVGYQYFEKDNSDLEIVLVQDHYGLSLTTREYDMCNVTEKCAHGSGVINLYKSLVEYGEDGMGR